MGETPRLEPKGSTPGISRLLDEIETKFQRLSPISMTAIPMELPVKLPVKNPRWWPQNFKYVYLISLHTWEQRNSNGYTYVFRTQLLWQSFTTKREETGSGKSKMAVNKLQIRISRSTCIQDSNKIPTAIGYLGFRARAIRLTTDRLPDVRISWESKMAVIRRK